jgi:hypothetical protein
MAIEEEAIATSVKLFRLFDVDVCMGSSSMLVICDETSRARECGLSLYPKGKSGYHLTAELWRLPASTGANSAPILPRSALAARRKEAQMRLFTIIVFLAVSLLAAPAQEQSVVAAPWQGAITGQIEAFRDADGAGALEFASSGFRVQFADPQMFYEAIRASGYEPIIDSRSHTFGEFEQVNETSVFQIVLFVGPDQGLYEAIYQMVEEPEGWRVEGVALRREQGVGI